MLTWQTPWRSVTRQSVRSAEWQFTRLSLRYLPTLVCGGECDPVPLCQPLRAPESFPYFAASCWCGDRWCYSKSRGNPDGFPFVLGPVSTTLPHFLPERRYFEDFRAGMGTSILVLKQEGRGGGSFFPHVWRMHHLLNFFSIIKSLSWQGEYEPTFKSRNLSPWARECWLHEDGYGCCIYCKFHRHHFHIPHWPTSLVERC